MGKCFLKMKVLIVLRNIGPYHNSRFESLINYLPLEYKSLEPEQKKLSIVHGDYGLHNCLIGDDSFVAAVVDWEISTLGDPLADLAYAINAFPDSSDIIPISPEAATAVRGFPERSQLAQRYGERTKTDLSKLDYYTGFNRWKSACIVQGLYARYMAGQKSSEGIDLEHMRERISIALTLSEQAVNRLPK